MRPIIEKGPGFRSGLRDLPRNINTKTITCAVTAMIFGCTGPALVTINAATQAGYGMKEIASWLFINYVIGGLFGMLMSTYYKVPLPGAFSITGVSMMGTILAGYSFQEAAGAFLIAGILVFLLGISGLVGKIMRWLPLPIVMGMIAGCMLHFGTGIVEGAVADPIVCGVTILAFFIVPRIFKKFPGILAAIIAGILTTIVTGDFAPVKGAMEYVPPSLVLPAFNPRLILSCSIPLTALVIGAETAQAIGVLYAQGYEPPVNAMITFSGIGGILNSFGGGHNANIAGPMTAICSSDDAGDKDGRYASAVLTGAFFVLFGIISSFAVAFIKFIPSTLVSVLAGLAMINVLIQAFSEGFKTLKFKTGAFAALIIGVADKSVFGIGPAFWALVIGVAVSLICDNKDFKQQGR